MAGTPIAAAVVATAAAMALGTAVLAGAASTAQRVAGAADAAALAAADASSGAVAVADEPCAVAGRVAAAMGARLDECAVDEQVANVQVSAAYAGTTAVARSRAGPPETGVGDG